MLTVWKFPLEPNFNELPMPRDAKVLSVVFEPRPMFGDGGLFMYALVDDEAETELRGFTVLGTGHPLVVPEGRELGSFIGTATFDSFYFHAFEVL